MARIGIRWHTGVTDELRGPHRAPRNRQTQPHPSGRDGHPARTDHPHRQLVDLLNAAGLTTGHGAPFDVKAVQWIRHAYHIPAPNPLRRR